jgi:hypothetical protein
MISNSTGKCQGGEVFKGTTSVLIPSLINIAEEMKRVLER